MGKVSYQESMREQKVVTNPTTTGLKAPGRLFVINAGLVSFVLHQNRLIQEI